MKPPRFHITPSSYWPALVEAAYISRGRVMDRAPTSAPWSSSAETMAWWPWATAHMSAVCPRERSTAFTLAPADRRRRAAAALPVREAVMSGVSPSGSAAFGWAPASSRRPTIAGLPFPAASQSAVAPSSFAASTSAPALMRRSAVCRSLRYAAQCRAVAPSACAALASAPAASSAWTVSVSWALAASISAAPSAPARAGAAVVPSAPTSMTSPTSRVVRRTMACARMTWTASFGECGRTAPAPPTHPTIFAMTALATTAPTHRATAPRGAHLPRGRSYRRLSTLTTDRGCDQTVRSRIT